MSDATSICDFWPYWWSSRRPEVRSYPPRCPTPYPLQLVNLRCCSNGAAVPVHPRSRSHDLSRTKPAVYQKPIQLSITRQTILVCLHERACSSATTKCHHLDRWDWPHTDSSLWFIAVNWPAQEEWCKWMKVRGQASEQPGFRTAAWDAMKESVSCLVVTLCAYIHCRWCLLSNYTCTWFFVVVFTLPNITFDNGTISNVNVVENINSSAPIVAKVCYDMTQVTKWIQMA